MDLEKPTDAHQQGRGDASWVSAAGVDAVNLRSVRVNHQSLTEEVARTVRRSAGEDAG